MGANRTLGARGCLSWVKHVYNILYALVFIIATLAATFPAKAQTTCGDPNCVDIMSAATDEFNNPPAMQWSDDNPMPDQTEKPH